MFSLSKPGVDQSIAMMLTPNATQPPPKGFCIKMGSDESHFNVSLNCEGQSHKTRPQITLLEEKGEPKRGIEPKSSV